MQRLLYLFLVIALTLPSCASKKRKSDSEPGVVKKFYHNLTAKYNGYFNANELLKKGFKTLEDSHQPNYSEIIAVYPYQDVDNASAVASDMDLAMQKVAKVVKLHGISHWVDDCYVLLGKAQYLKQDYETAEETFAYFEEEFDPSNPKSRLYNASKNKKKSKGEKIKAREKEKKLKAAKMKEAKKEKAATKEDQKEERIEKKKEEDKFRKEIKELKTDLRKATKKRKDKIRKAKEKARKEKKRNSNIKDEPSAKELELEQKIKNKEAEQERFKNGTIEEEEEVKEEELVAEKEGADDKKEKTKKKKITDQGGLFKHKPVFHEGVFWLARTFIERENYFSADFLLSKLENEYPTSDEVKKQIPAARAHLHLKQNQNDLAIPHLAAAIKSVGDKKLRARYAYIMGQIHQRAGRESEALMAFENVKKHKPDYSMSFNSKLNLAKSEYKSGASSKAQAIDGLEDMLGDNKNFDFKDQVHYTIGEIKEEAEDLNGAIDSYQNAVNTSTTNKAQKLEAYYKIALLEFSQDDFLTSKNYYDSTLVEMKKDDQRYQTVKDYAGGLKEIADQMQIISLQDSMLLLSSKTKPEQEAVVRKILEDQLALAKLNAEAKENPAAGRKRPKKSSLITGGFANRSGFFIYGSEIEISNGTKSFKEKWGSNRKLTDNWRRSNRQGAFADEIEEEEEEVEEEGVADSDIAAMMRTIPNTPPQKDKANKEIEDALHQLGVLFRNKISHNEKSIESLDRLLASYPKTKHRLDAFFYLYLAHTDLGNTAEAARYKALLSSDFPDADFTQSIVNPDFLSEMQSTDEKNNEYYDETYALFKSGSHEGVLKRVDEAFKRFGQKNPLLPKFTLLQAMSVGKVSGKDAYIASLDKLVKRYPNTPEEARAREILRFLRGDSKAFNKSFYQEAEELFTPDDDKLHYILVVVYDRSEKVLNDAKIKISDYNKKYYKLDKLRISDIYLSKEAGAESQIILLRKFRNKKKAMEYYNNIEKNRVDFLNQDQVGFDVFAATQKNYREIAKKKDITTYRAFFDKYYLEKK